MQYHAITHAMTPPTNPIEDYRNMKRTAEILRECTMHGLEGSIAADYLGEADALDAKADEILSVTTIAELRELGEA